MKIFDVLEIGAGGAGMMCAREAAKRGRRVGPWTMRPRSAPKSAFPAADTRDGEDTNELSSKIMESKKVPGLYSIGEVVDVTGWLGGYNFQWAWSSGWAAGQVA